MCSVIILLHGSPSGKERVMTAVRGDDDAGSAERG